MWCTRQNNTANYKATTDTRLKERRIKVLRFIARLNIGGPAIHVHLLTRGLDINKFQPILVTGRISPHEGDMSYLFSSRDEKPIIIPDLHREISPLMDIKVILKIFKILRRERPDIVHTHTAKAGTVGRIAVVLYKLLCRQKVRIVHTFHGHVFEGYFSKTKSWIFLLIECFLARATRVIIAISETQKRELSEKYRIAPASKIKTVELGFDLSPFLSNTSLKGRFRQSIGVSDHTLLIAIIGRLVPIKNHIMFFDGVKIFLEQNPETRVKFIVLGDGELKDELKAYCEKQGLANQVLFCGWMRDVPVAYADLDILALTSLNEGTPVSIIEAMASSVPVIATDAGGVRDLMGPPDGVSSSNGFTVCERGVLCKKNDASGFAKALNYLVEVDIREKKDRLMRARSFVEKRYSSKRLLRDIESLYFDLMNVYLYKKNGTTG